MYEKTAIIYSTESGMPGKSKQQIQMMINADMKALSIAKFGLDVLTENTIANNKVFPLHLLLIFPEIHIIPPQIMWIYREQARE